VYALYAYGKKSFAEISKDLEVQIWK